MIVKEEATSIHGTTAYLKPGDQVSYLQLLYGMMLPSGNDAAYTIASNFGVTLCNTKYANCSLASKSKIKAITFRNELRYFLYEMNLQAKELGMIESFFDSPHGLGNKYNVSTINDLAKLTQKCM
jgi:D-alanyl-D-alanine carboxypeptidase (penicillin-binding protein 5/6)